MRTLDSRVFVGLVVGSWLLSGVARAAPFAYVPDSFDSTVSVIDTATNAVVATVPIAGTGHGVAVLPDGSAAYVTTLGNNINVVHVIDTSTNTVVETISAADLVPSQAVVAHPDGRFVYVGTWNGVAIIDTATNSVVDTVALAGWPWSLGVLPDGSAELSPGFDVDFGPLPLFVVQPSFPTGTWALDCRLNDPITQKQLHVDRNTFELIP